MRRAAAVVALISPLILAGCSTSEPEVVYVTETSWVVASEQPRDDVPSVAPAPAEDDDEDVDLFGSDDEEDDEEKKRITEERLKAYHEKKAKKPKVIAKTSVLFDVKPWDDETDMDVSRCGVVLLPDLISLLSPGNAEGVQVHRDGGPCVGSQQARPCRLRDQ